MNWKTKSAAAIVASGLANGGEAQGQPSGNLVLNPSFEILTIGGTAENWTGSALGTYLYSQGYTSINVPPSPGLRYLAGPPAAATGNTVQSLDLVALGFSPAFLDAGAQYDLSAYFSSYGHTDFGTITASFRDTGGVTIGTSAPIGGAAFIDALGTGPNVFGFPDYTDWGQSGTSGVLPVGTRSILIDILHTRRSGTFCDSYVDLVDFRVTAVPEPGTLLLTSAAGVTLVLRLRRRPKTAIE